MKKNLIAPILAGIAPLGLIAPSTGPGSLPPGRLPAEYTVVSIGTLPGGGNSHANGINSTGAVAGTATDTSNGYNNRAVLYTSGRLINLGVLDVPFPLSSEALALSDEGEVV